MDNNKGYFDISAIEKRLWFMTVGSKALCWPCL
jgi:hypothetical protein